MIEVIGLDEKDIDKAMLDGNGLPVRAPRDLKDGETFLMYMGSAEPKPKSIFDLARELHQQTADLFADGDTKHVEIHFVDGEVSVLVDGKDIDWKTRLADDFYGMIQAVTE